MSPDAWNAMGEGIALSHLPIWVALEVVLLLKRRETVRVHTISMLMLRRSYQLNALPFFWGGMGAHFFWPSKEFAPVWAGVLFWILLVGVLVADIVLWRLDRTAWPKWTRVVRHPAVVMGFAFVAGKVLFPQVG